MRTRIKKNAYKKEHAYVKKNSPTNSCLQRGWGLWGMLQVGWVGPTDSRLRRGWGLWWDKKAYAYVNEHTRM